MLITKRCIIPSSLNNCIEVLLLMLLIAQIMMILKFEDKKVISTGYIIVKAAGCLGNYAANNPLTQANALGLGLFAA